MPFDSIELDDGITAFARFHDEPSLRGLSYALRHSELWPDGFKWDYSDSNTCAIGLAVRLTARPQSRWMDLRVLKWLDQTFREDHHQFNLIFCHAHVPLRLFSFEVTAVHVADAIDRYLRRV